MHDLFRPEVVENQIKRLQGEVLLGLRQPWLITGYLAAGVIIFGFVFSCFASYARKETVSGRIVPSQGIIRVTARSGGVIERISAREGESVRQGQPLASVRLSLGSGDEDAGAAMERAVQNEIAALQATTTAQLSQLSADRQHMAAQEKIYVAQKTDAMQLKGYLIDKRDIAARNFSRAKSLHDQGFLSDQALDAAQTAIIEADQAIASQSNAILNLEQNLADVRAKLSALPLIERQVSSQGNSTYAATLQKLQQTRVGNRYTVTAPINGTVVGIPGYTGQALTAGDAVMVLTPSGNPLQVELFIPTRAAGFIRVGNEVSLQYDAFSYRTFGSGRGKVTSISKTLLTPAEASRLGVEVSQPVFRAEVSLEKDFVSAYGKKIKLQPGMLLSAQITLDKRSLLEWALDPLYAVGRR